MKFVTILLSVMRNIQTVAKLNIYLTPEISSEAFFAAIFTVPTIEFLKQIGF